MPGEADRRRAIAVAEHDVRPGARRGQPLRPGTAEAERFEARRKLERAEAAAEDRTTGVVGAARFLFPRREPRSADIPARSDERRQIGVFHALPCALALDADVFGLDREGSRSPSRFEPDAPAGTAHPQIGREEGRVERRPAPKGRDALGDVAAGESRTELQIAQERLRRSKRLHGRPSGGRRAAEHTVRVVRSRVSAVAIEEPRLVLKHVQHTAMHHDAAIAAGRELCGGTRSIDEVEIGAAGVLVEAEGELELSRLHLQMIELPVVDVHVSPVLVGRKLVLDLIVDHAGHPALDADAAPRDVECGRIAKLSLGLAEVPPHARAEVDPRAVADLKPRVFLPSETPDFGGRGRGRRLLARGVLLRDRWSNRETGGRAWWQFLPRER